MKESEIVAELDREPFRPFRLHMVSGKVFEILAANVAHPLVDSLLVLRNPVLGTRRAEGYDVIAYANIERIEQLEIGRPPKKRRSA
jgi:hypothetical protein